MKQGGVDLNTKPWLAIVGLSFLPALFWANESHSASTYRYFTTISSSLEYIRSGNPVLLSLLPPFVNYYTSPSLRQTSGALGLGLGIEKQVYDNFSLQLGVAGNLNTTIQAGMWCNLLCPNMTILATVTGFNRVASWLLGNW